MVDNLVEEGDRVRGRLGDGEGCLVLRDTSTSCNFVELACSCYS